MRELKGWLTGLLMGLTLLFFFVPLLGAISRVQTWHHWIGWNILPIVAGNFLLGYGMTAALEINRSSQARAAVLGLATVAVPVLVLSQFQMPTLSSGGFCGTCNRAGWEALAAILMAWGIVTKSTLVVIQASFRGAGPSV